MYAQHSYVPSGSRPVSFGAALAVNALILVGMATFVPKIVPIERPPFIVDTYRVREVPPPDPEPTKVEKQPETIPFKPTPFVDPPPILKAPEMTTTMTENRLTAGPGVADLRPVEIEPVQPPSPPVFRAAETDPRFAGAFQPDYPTQEIRAGREGRVAVKILIGADGRVKAVEQLSATSSAFFEATRRHALARWRFKPATRGGTPEESWKTMKVRFVLTGG